MNGFELTPQEVKRLRVLHKQQKDRRAADKIKTVVLLGTGWTLSAVSEALLLDEGTLRGYIDRYRNGGINKVLEWNYQGRSCQLSPEQQQALKDHLSEYTYPDTKSIIAYIEKTYGILYKHSGMAKLLHQLGFVYKKPKLVSPQADPVEVMKYLQAYEEVRRSGKPLYFMDGVHPQHNSRPGEGWILKGEAKALLSNTGRKRLNINGAINIDSKQLIVEMGTAVNAQTTIVLLQAILDQHPMQEEIVVVCDNAGYYRSHLVREFVEKAKRIRLLFLPAYSPFLNLIERVWKYFNKCVLYNKYYPYFSDFKAACLDFFNRSHKRALDKKLVEKFHFSDKNLTALKLKF